MEVQLVKQAESTGAKCVKHILKTSFAFKLSHRFLANVEEKNGKESLQYSKIKITLSSFLLKTVDGGE